REFEVRPLDDRLDRTGLLAEAAIDALHHVDVVAYRAPRSVIAPRPRLDGDRLRRADSLAQLAGNAALLAIGIAAQGMFAPKARRKRPLLVRVVDRVFRPEHLPHRQDESLHE